MAVPTGNFGNVLAAWAASKMGLPIAKFIVASNRNDILFRFLAANDMSVREVTPSYSPSMDIGVSSNFERLLFEFLGRDATLTAATLKDFRSTGKMAVADPVWRAVRQKFTGFRLDDAGTLAEIGKLYRETGYLADPHSVIGLAAARECGPGRRAGNRRGNRASGKISRCDRKSRGVQACLTRTACRPI